MDTLLAAIITDYLYQIPVYLIWTGGIVMAVLHRKRHPKASLFTIIALGLFLIRGLAGPYLFSWLPTRIIQEGVARKVVAYRTILEIVWSLSSTIPWGMLMLALFWWQIKEGLDGKDSTV